MIKGYEVVVGLEVHALICDIAIAVAVNHLVLGIEDYRVDSLTLNDVVEHRATLGSRLCRLSSLRFGLGCSRLDGAHTRRVRRAMWLGRQVVAHAGRKCSFLRRGRKRA